MRVNKVDVLVLDIVWKEQDCKRRFILNKAITSCKKDKESSITVEASSNFELVVHIRSQLKRIIIIK